MDFEVSKCEQKHKSSDLTAGLPNRDSEIYLHVEVNVRVRLPNISIGYLARQTLPKITAPDPLSALQ